MKLCAKISFQKLKSKIENISGIKIPQQYLKLDIQYVIGVVIQSEHSNEDESCIYFTNLCGGIYFKNEDCEFFIDTLPHNEKN